jgi:threonine dehydrogenase-like Zn-dependent dehydrogenase
MEINDLVGKHILGFRFDAVGDPGFTKNMSKVIGKRGKIIGVGVSGKNVGVEFEDDSYYWYPIDHPDFKIVDEDAPVQGEKLLFSIV